MWSYYGFSKWDNYALRSNITDSKVVITMRIVLGLVWCYVLFVCTCTVSLRFLLSDSFIHFRFTAHPNWRELWIVSDINLHYKFYVMSKIGHFSGFFILSLIFTNFGRIKKGLLLSIGYAVLTEILQLFFHRDGRIVDMFIDSAGILLAYWICGRLLDSSKKAA